MANEPGEPPHDEAGDALEQQPGGAQEQPPAQSEPGPIPQPPAEFTAEWWSYFWSAPLPHPRIAEGWKDLVPTAPERILAMAESEQRHRHGQDRLFAVYRFVGLLLGAVAALGGLLLAAYLIRRGDSGYAVAAFLGEIVALAGLFVLGRYVGRNGFNGANGRNGPDG
jgi:uncharacterized membrane protein